MKRSSHVMLCNGAPAKAIPAHFRRNAKREELAYTALAPENANLDIGLPSFVSSVYHLPDRVLDLLEIAAYVFCADRWVGRGANDAVEYDGWGRTIHYVIKVRDHAFWQRSDVSKALDDALKWVTGDESHSFTFLPGHSTPATTLFDKSGIQIEATSNAKVALFSGGIDSLTGAVQHLRQEPGPLYLVSHRSSSIVQRTQQLILRSLQTKHSTRIQPYAFTCRLKGKRAEEETQRSRSFLFSSIAYALASALQQDRFYIYENGVTSLNLPKREGMGHGRASRTTHPRTITRFEQFLTIVHGSAFSIETPFFWKTKTEVLTTLHENGGTDLLDTSVSCTRTFDNEKDKTHCGGCSQCVDRRFSAVAAGLSEQDHSGLYTRDIIKDRMDPETRTFVVDYLAQARLFATLSADAFEKEYLHELADIEDHVRDVPKEQRLDRLHDLCNRHGMQIMEAARRLNDPMIAPKPGTLLAMLNSREYLKTPVVRLCEAVCKVLSRGLPTMFKGQKPADENDFNDKVDGLLTSHQSEFKREHPVASFARAKMVPDHLNPSEGFLIETKYIRGATTPSKVTDGLAADMFKLPPSFFKLLVVYDPERAIPDDDEFRQAFESRGNCRVLLVR
jgi:7-cyano-7-deazaguanine synthase in queuosine biosynthesis